MEKVDVLHGITMQEPGVSKLISVELEQAQKQAEQQAAV
jgi:chromosome segregation ATPase